MGPPPGPPALRSPSYDPVLALKALPTFHVPLLPPCVPKGHVSLLSPMSPKDPGRSLVIPSLSSVDPVLAPEDPRHPHVPLLSLCPQKTTVPPPCPFPVPHIPILSRFLLEALPCCCPPGESPCPLPEVSPVPPGCHPVPVPPALRYPVSPGCHPVPVPRRLPAPALTLEQLRSFLRQMQQLPCVMHQLGEVQVSPPDLPPETPPRDPQRAPCTPTSHREGPTHKHPKSPTQPPYLP